MRIVSSETNDCSVMESVYRPIAKAREVQPRCLVTRGVSDGVRETSLPVSFSLLLFLFVFVECLFFQRLFNFG